MIKRTFLTLCAAALALGVMIAVEIVVAVRRDYLPTEPALEIGGTFGSGARAATLVVLGDSTGAGVGADGPDTAYPALLASRLAEDLGLNLRLVDLAVSGARVHDVLSEQVPAALEHDADVYLVAIGANDVTHLTGLGSVRSGVEDIVGRLSNSGVEVVVAGAPDMRAPAFAEPLRSIVGWRGRAVTDEIERAARREGAVVVPLADRTRGFFRDQPESHYSADLFHPSATGYARWADAFYPEVRAVLLDSL